MPRSWIAAAALAAACATPVDSGDAGGVSLVGTWSFAATQSSPTRVETSGTLQILRQSGAAFDGRVEVVEIDTDGQTRRASGIVTGRLIDGSTVDFDTFLGAGARRHLGTLANDVLQGTWVEPNGTGTASGSFTATRRR